MSAQSHPDCKMSEMLRYLQGWIGVVGLMAIGNTFSCFYNHSFLAERLYTGAPEQVNGLMARLFGMWTLLSAALRLYCSYDITNKTVYNLTYFSFLLAFGHFITECYVYKTAPITIGTMAPLLVSGISIVWMSIGYNYFHRPDDEDDVTLRKLRSTNDIPLIRSRARSKKH